MKSARNPTEQARLLKNSAPVEQFMQRAGSDGLHIEYEERKKKGSSNLTKIRITDDMEIYPAQTP